jgi:hypothetical protein
MIIDVLSFDLVEIILLSFVQVLADENNHNHNHRIKSCDE